MFLRSETKLDPPAYRLTSFLDSIGLSRSVYYRLPHDQRLTVFYIGTTPFVTADDAHSWIKQLRDDQNPKQFTDPLPNPENDLNGEGRHGRIASQETMGGSNV